jgi:outer membrane receptor protein involved in Fe transport
MGTTKRFLAGTGAVLAAFSAAAAAAADTSVGLCTNPSNPDEIFGTNYHTAVREPAVFGELSYQITSALKATAGLRWSQVKTTAGGYQEGSVTQSPGAPPRAMVYTMISKGFRPGGLVPSVPAATCGAELPPGDIQQNILLPCGFQYRANAGAAQSKGGELFVCRQQLQRQQSGGGERRVRDAAAAELRSRGRTNRVERPALGIRSGRKESDQ